MDAYELDRNAKDERMSTPGGAMDAQDLERELRGEEDTLPLADEIAMREDRHLENRIRRAQG